MAADFGPFEGRVWLNTAHQGPLPRRATEEAREAVAWKAAPHELTQERFLEVPRRLREALARLLAADAQEIVLGNSASHGLHLLANGIPWQAGDEVLLVRGDFPADILPWLALEHRGVRIRFLEPDSHLPIGDELRAGLTPSTRLFCSTWVHSFSGVTADLAELGKICRDRKVLFVANVSQGLGARPLAVTDAPLDAVVGAGFKWLCGPYGTGFCWMRPELLGSLRYNQAYWLTEMTAADLGEAEFAVPRPKSPPSARTYDVFGTANFFNFKPWAAAIEYLLDVGLQNVAAHDQALVDQLIDGLEARGLTLLSPRTGPRRSTLVFVSHPDPARNRELHEDLRRAGVDSSLRRGHLRLSPHLHNTEQDIERALAALT